MHQPCGPATQLHPVHVGHALVEPERGDAAGVLVLVRCDRQATEIRKNVVREHPGLADRVLRGGAGRGALTLREVRNRGAVTRRPCLLDTVDLEEGRRLDTAPLVKRKVGVGKKRVRLDPGGPDNGLGVELLAAVENNMTIDETLHPGVYFHFNTAVFELLQRVQAHRRRNFGKYPPARLDHYPAHVRRRELGIETTGVARHILKLGNGLDTSEPAADEHKGERSTPQLGIIAGRRGVHSFDDLVSNIDRLGHALETDAQLGQTRDRQGPRDRPGASDEDVIAQFVRRALIRRNIRPSLGVIDAGHAAADHPAAIQHST